MMVQTLYTSAIWITAMFIIIIDHITLTPLRQQLAIVIEHRYEN